MWLRLYQSASIWLVFALSRSPTQSTTVPQVQIGFRPIASWIAAAAIRMSIVNDLARREIIRGHCVARSDEAIHRRITGLLSPD